MLLAPPPSAMAGHYPPHPPPHTRPRAADRKHATMPWERASVAARAVAGGLQIDRNGAFVPGITDWPQLPAGFSR
jgi:hypothetical protein